MKRLAVLSLTAAVFLGSATVAAAQCQLQGFTQLPSNPPTPIALGPLMVSYASTYPEVANAIAAGRDAWNVTDAHDRIGGYGGQTNSDCPLNQPFQIGAHNFTYDQCATTQAYGYNIPPPNPNEKYLAYVDYFPWYCAGCGTKSISLNTDGVAWAVNPGPGQYDLQSVIAHEFGHVLGLGHMRADYGFCLEQNGPSCAQDPNRSTMQRNMPAGTGETCARNLNGQDIGNANYWY